MFLKHFLAVVLILVSIFLAAFLCVLAIYKAMAGEPVSCPICMCSVVRPTVTKCAHLVREEIQIFRSGKTEGTMRKSKREAGGG